MDGGIFSELPCKLLREGEVDSIHYRVTVGPLVREQDLGIGVEHLGDGETTLLLLRAGATDSRSADPSSTLLALVFERSYRFRVNECDQGLAEWRRRIELPGDQPVPSEGRVPCPHQGWAL